MRFTAFIILFSALCLITTLAASLPGYVNDVDESHPSFSLEKRRSKMGYYCSKSKITKRRRFYKRKEINEAATKACERLGATKILKWSYPANYAAASYAVPGPYLEWPIGYSGPISTKRINRDRIVINTQCDVVDVVSRRKDGKYQQCEPKWK
ncbi:hypothetical protein K3495_g9965 [Podosphaera aphanis]|nr:hypothetical protein K3495_g9965 [Podosphaera aphanis]